ncbi:hypothetical protein EMIT0P4_30042 [Pseudomonas sp. IT-P4]
MATRRATISVTGGVDIVYLRKAFASLRIGTSPGTAPGWWAATRNKQGLFLIPSLASVTLIRRLAVSIFYGNFTGQGR